MSAPCPIKQFSVGPSSWTPILTPINCAFYAIFCPNDGSIISRCSNPADPTTSHVFEDTYYSFVVPPSFFKYRWQAGDTVTYLQASQSTTVAVEFVPADGTS